MPGRNFNSSSYRYNFNGKESDPETGTQDYGMRIYNPSLGRFLSVDPLTADYPELTPYQFASNTPIQAVDLDGLEQRHYLLTKNDGKTQFTLMYVEDDFVDTYLQESAIYVHYNNGIYKFGKVEPGVFGIGQLPWFVLHPEEAIAWLNNEEEEFLTNVYIGSMLGLTEQATGAFHYTAPGRYSGGNSNKNASSNTATKKAQLSANNGTSETGTNSATANRVKLRKATVEKIKENQPRNEQGQMIDPNTKQVLNPKKIDIGHKSGQEWRVRKVMHENRGSTRKEVIEAENNPDLYHLEDRASNRSHKYEQTSKD